MNDSIENDPIGAAIDALDAQIAKFQSAKEALESVRSMMGLPAASAGSRGGHDVQFGHDAFFGMSAADAAKKYLASVKKTAAVKTIADTLVAGGWKTAAKNIPENLRTILARTPTFVLINGQFGLSEWYPGRKVGSKVRSVSQAPAVGDVVEVEIDLESPMGEIVAVREV
jgi:hypothetical protein